MRGVEEEKQIEKSMAKSEFIFHLKLLTDTLHFSRVLNLSFYVSRQCTKSSNTLVLLVVELQRGMQDDSRDENCHI